MTSSAVLTDPPVLLKLISHQIRWQLLQLLAQSDLKVQELVNLLNQPQNLVSYHLQKLRKHQLINEHKSIADGREIYYSLDMERVKALFFSSGKALHPALEEHESQSSNQITSSDPIRVLFLCTHNSARSQMAEGILRDRARGQIEVFSAGTDPATIHPMAIRALAEMGIDISNHHSKSLDQFVGQAFDYIITVCDRARESCPVFPWDPVRIHWSFPDPAGLEGSEAERYQAFKETALQLNTRITYLITMIRRSWQEGFGRNSPGV